MASICSSCQVLGRGLLFGRRPAQKLFSSVTWQKRSFSLMRQKHSSSKITSHVPPFPRVSGGVGTRSLFSGSTRLSEENHKKKDNLDGGEALSSDSSRDREKKEFEDKLTPEELEVLREIEEEERKLRGELNDYNIWDDDGSGGGNLDERKLSGSLSEDYVPFRDQGRVIQDVIDEMWNPLPEVEEEEELPVIYPRGKTGVFDLGELVDLLREEKGDEIVAITIPKEIDYADHMVIVTVRNNRHLMALATFVRKRFKMKERKRSDTLPFLEKTRNHKGWIALDLGNIILHVFLQDVRDYYDLEMLWTVGPVYDDLYNAEDSEIVQLLNTFE